VQLRWKWGKTRGSFLKEAEHSLIDRALHGSSDAFADLVGPHLPSLSRFVRSRLWSGIEAEDVIQRSLLRAFSHLRQFRGQSSFKTWLSAITLNEIYQSRSAARLRPIAGSLACTLADPATSPYMQCEQIERAQQLRKALAMLPSRYRLVIQLRDLREFTIAETARSLSLSSGAVRTRHHRARKLLKRSLVALQGNIGNA
jgi:RNA polymerase sigma-70 factor (ECF subfamily)